MPVKSVYLIISGRVQGVGFRYFAELKATELNISGWVKNTPDGKVEIEATGEYENMDIFINWIKIGPSRAIIKTVSASDIIPNRTFTKFITR